METGAVRPYHQTIKRVSSLAVRVISTYQAKQRDERGASMVEYAFLIALIAMVAFVAVAFVGQALDHSYDTISQSVANA